MNNEIALNSNSSPVSVAQQTNEVRCNIAPDPELTQLVNDLREVSSTSNSNESTLIALATVSSPFAPQYVKQPEVHIKVKTESVDGLKKILGATNFKPFDIAVLQGAEIRNHWLKQPHATAISVYQLDEKLKGVRGSSTQIKPGHHFVLNTVPLPANYKPENLLCSLVLSQADNDQVKIFNVPSDQQKETLQIIQTRNTLFALKNKAKIQQLLASQEIAKPAHMDEDYFQCWKPILILAALSTQQHFATMYQLMLANNPTKNQLPDEIDLLVGIKAVYEYAKAYYKTKDAIASMTLVGELKHLGYTNTSASKVKATLEKYKVKNESIEHHHITANGYKHEELETMFTEKLDLNDPLTKQRYDELTAMLNQQHAA
jgi:hypothetical protein